MDLDALTSMDSRSWGNDGTRSAVSTTEKGSVRTSVEPDACGINSQAKTHRRAATFRLWKIACHTASSTIALTIATTQASQPSPTT